MDPHLQRHCRSTRCRQTSTDELWTGQAAISLIECLRTRNCQGFLLLRPSLTRVRWPPVATKALLRLGIFGDLSYGSHAKSSSQHGPVSDNGTKPAAVNSTLATSNATRALPLQRQQSQPNTSTTGLPASVPAWHGQSTKAPLFRHWFEQICFSYGKKAMATGQE